MEVRLSLPLLSLPLLSLPLLYWGPPPQQTTARTQAHTGAGAALFRRERRVLQMLAGP